MYYFNRQTGDYGDAKNLIFVPDSEIDHNLIPEGSDSEVIDMAMEYEKTQNGAQLADEYVLFLKDAAGFEQDTDKETRDVDALLELQREVEAEAVPQSGYRDLL